jgi:signal transduction histidine kinase
MHPTPDFIPDGQILIVDDTPANIDVLDQILEEEGYKISVAATGEAALKLAPKIIPDLILLDIMMPGIDGFETCQQLKADPTTRDIPILFLTAKNEGADIARGFSLGAVDYITKPFLEEEVCARIRFHLQRRQLLRQLKESNHKLTEVNELKNKFLGMASHDLRSPITSIRGYARILLDQSKDLPEDARLEFLDAIHEISGHMLNLLSDLLNISMIESGKLELRIVSGSLKTVVEERTRIFKFIAEKKNISIHSELDAIPNFCFDANRIGQVVDNLLSNAIKFSPAGKEIRIFLKQNQDQAVFSVQDKGPGISQEDQEKLFQHFQKLEPRPTGDEPSHGLGLAIAKKMIEAHRGILNVESAPGKGATFSFEIPMSSKTSPDL